MLPTLCPLEKRKIFDQRGSAVERRLPVFGSYFFVDAPLGEDPKLWHLVSDWPYVAEIMGGINPWPVIEDEILWWQDQIDAESVIVDRNLLKKIRQWGRMSWFEAADAEAGIAGTRVQVTQGKMTGATGTIIWIDDAHIRVGVKIDALLGVHPVHNVLAAWCRKIDDELDNGGSRRKHHRPRGPNRLYKPFGVAAHRN